MYVLDLFDLLDQDRPMLPGPPCWLDDATLRRFRIASAGAHANRDPAAIRDMVWARFPALPLPAIEEAVGFLQPPRAAASRPRFLLGRLARILSRIRPPMPRLAKDLPAP